MLTASWIGMAVCAVLAVVHLARVASPERSKLDIPAELCHVFMNFSMAYMFAPIPSVKVIPDTLWALAFAVLALGFVARALVYDRQQALGNAAHSVMNLSMVYMFMQATWDNTFVTGIFVLFFAGFATVHAAQLLPGKTRGTLSFKTAFSPVSHVLMSAAMIFMFLMPALMPSGGYGHGHHHHHGGTPAIGTPEAGPHDHQHGHHHGEHKHAAPAEKPATQPKPDCHQDGQGQHKHHCH
jgi:predicted secreted protein